MKNQSHGKLYKRISELIVRAPMTRSELINKCCEGLRHVHNEECRINAGSEECNLRGTVGTVINDMHAAGVIAIDKNGRYYAVTTRPVMIRVERCEREILKALSERPYLKSDLRERLKGVFGTNKTATSTDDDILSTYVGQLLKKLTLAGVIRLVGNEYSLSEAVSARADDMNQMLTLKAEFISRLHSKGGEFFENYFMQLLGKYMKKQGKKVHECYVTGGSSDGGIDGVIKTEDSLGFKETIMVQTKNRIEIATETDVRGFYGAVCARRGSRGMYVISSDFHDGAEKFLAELDDCVGVNGQKLFSMAIECQYGIKRKNGRLLVDSTILK